jgi:nitrogenase molybdenum-iron protein beta chain
MSESTTKATTETIKKSTIVPTAGTSSVSGEPAEAPRYSCALGGILASLLNINMCIPIVHAGPGCAFGQTLGFTWGGAYQGVGYIGGSALPCTNLAEKDVVFGGEGRLREQIKTTLELVDGDFYVVVNSCIPSMIGDDIKQVVKEFGDSKVPVYYVNIAGFSGTSYQGYDWALKALIEQSIPDRKEKEIKKQKGLVNVLGIIPYQDLFWRGNIKEIKNIFNCLCLDTNLIFDQEEGLQSIKKLAEAELTIVMSPWTHQETVELLKEKFDIPYVRFPYIPVGGQETTKFIRKIAKYVSIPENVLEKTIIDGEKHAYKLLDTAADIVSMFISAQNFQIVADSNVAISLSKFLVDEAGFNPSLVIITDNPPEWSRQVIEEELTNYESPLKPIVIFEPDSYKIWEILKNHENLNVVLGSSLDRFLVENLNCKHLSIAYPTFNRLVVERSYAGYAGGAVLLEDILDKLAMPF